MLKLLICLLFWYEGGITENRVWQLDLGWLNYSVTRAVDLAHYSIATSTLELIGFSFVTSLFLANRSSKLLQTKTLLERPLQRALVTPALGKVS